MFLNSLHRQVPLTIQETHLAQTEKTDANVRGFHVYDDSNTKE